MNETPYTNPTPTQYPTGEPVQQVSNFPYHAVNLQAEAQAPTPEAEPEQVKPYTLKRLQSKDIFPMLRILSKINFQELKACFSSPEIAAAVAKLADEGEEGKEEDIFSAVGLGVVFDVAGVIVNNIPKCEAELYSFLANLSGMDEKAIMELDAAIFFEMIVDVIRKPEFKDFIKVASGLLK